MANTKIVLYLVLAIIILFFISIRLSFGVKVYVNTDCNFGQIVVSFFFIPIYVKKIDLRRTLNGRTLSRDKDEDEQSKQEKSESGPFKKFLIDCAIKILRAVCVKNASLQAKIGTGDAALDGMAVGWFRIMYSQFCAFFGFNGDGATIEPDYNSEILFFDFFGIFSISFADIIFAVCCVIVKRITHFGERRSYANVAE